MTRKLTLIAGTLFVLALVLANLMWGSVSIPASDAIRIIFGDTEELPVSWTYIILENRLPAALTAMLTGAALGTGGLLLQTTFRNPLAGPSILGIDSGANLGVALVMLLLGNAVTLGSMSIGGYLLIVLAAMMGSWVIMLLLLAFSARLQSHVMLLITGIMISYITGSLISLLNYSATAEGVHAYMMWGMGNFGAVSMDRIPLFALLCVVGLASALLMMKPLNVMLMGDNYATNLGFSVRSTRTRLLLITGLLTATTTAFCGPITFLGLAVPHLARLTTGTHNHQQLLPSTMLIGSSLALLCNLLSTLPSGSLIPINVITPCIGAPIVILIILKKI